MGVPAHDARDYDFAKKFGIEIIEVIHNPEESTHLPYLASGILKIPTNLIIWIPERRKKDF